SEVKEAQLCLIGKNFHIDEVFYFSNPDVSDVEMREMLGDLSKKLINYSRMYKVLDMECNAVKKERDLLKSDLESRDVEYKNPQLLEIDIDSLNAIINSQKSQIETQRKSLI
ncbi:hypothetical protein Droror1_Dr00002304, partial [Drosera rotundifolia]